MYPLVLLLGCQLTVMKGEVLLNRALSLILLPLDLVCLMVIKRARLRREIWARERYHLDGLVRLGEVTLNGKNIAIGKYSYVRSGDKGSIDIGKYCAIGKNVSIKARTHDLRRPTGNEQNKRNMRIEASIKNW